MISVKKESFNRSDFGPVLESENVFITLYLIFSLWYFVIDCVFVDYFVVLKLIIYLFYVSLVHIYIYSLIVIGSVILI